MEEEIKIPVHSCTRCGYKWYLRKPQRPRMCPKCKSPYWGFSSEYKQELDNDILLARKLTQDITNTMVKLHQDPSYWEKIIKIGFERMFSTSEFPVKNIQTIFDKGFSIDEWFLKVAKTPQVLADDIVQKCVKHKQLKNVSNLELEKIQQLLDWKNVLENVNDEGVKILAFLWLADELASSVKYPEAMYLIYEKSWSLLQDYSKLKKEEIIGLIEGMVRNIDERSKGVTSWYEIIRFP